MHKDILKPSYLKAISNYMHGDSEANALRKAGFSESTATTQPGYVFRRPEVIREIKRRQQRLANKAQIDLEWILDKYKKIVEAEIADIIIPLDKGGFRYDFNNLTPELRTAMVDLSNGKVVKVGLLDKLKALEAISKLLGLVTDKVEVAGDTDFIRALQEGRNRISKDKVDE